MTEPSQTSYCWHCEARSPIVRAVRQNGLWQGGQLTGVVLRTVLACGHEKRIVANPQTAALLLRELRGKGERP